MLLPFVNCDTVLQRVNRRKRNVQLLHARKYHGPRSKLMCDCPRMGIGQMVCNLQLVVSCISIFEPVPLLFGGGDTER
jgi:hypothetical protein